MHACRSRKACCSAALTVVQQAQLHHAAAQDDCILPRGHHAGVHLRVTHGSVPEHTVQWSGDLYDTACSKRMEHVP